MVDNFSVMHQGQVMMLRPGLYIAIDPHEITYVIRQIEHFDDVIIVHAYDPIYPDDHIKLTFPYADVAMETGQIIATGQTQDELTDNIITYIKAMDEKQKQNENELVHNLPEETTDDFESALRANLDKGLDDDNDELYNELPTLPAARHEPMRNDTQRESESEGLGDFPFNANQVDNTIDTIGDNFVRFVLSEVGYGTYFPTLRREEVPIYVDLLIRQVDHQLQSVNPSHTHKVSLLLKKKAMALFIKGMLIERR
jgi:hypothetical protein